MSSANDPDTNPAPSTRKYSSAQSTNTKTIEYLHRSVHCIVYYASIVPLSLLWSVVVHVFPKEIKRDMFVDYFVESASNYVIIILTIATTLINAVIEYSSKDVDAARKGELPSLIPILLNRLRKSIKKDLSKSLRLFQALLALFFAAVRRHFKFLWRLLDHSSLLLVSCCRFFSGAIGAHNLNLCQKPNEPLILFEFEACAKCKSVREIFSVLELDHIIYPCPRETIRTLPAPPVSRYRLRLQASRGDIQLPFLIDPNTDTQCADASCIIKHLWKTYGDKSKAPFNYKLVSAWDFLNNISMFSHVLLRPLMDMGVLRIPSREPALLLELWGYEGSPSTKKVREVLSCLELPYQMNEMPLFSKKRSGFILEHRTDLPFLSRSFGFCSLPYMNDKNTGTTLFGSEKIVTYLKNTYRVGDLPEDNWIEYEM